GAGKRVQHRPRLILRRGGHLADLYRPVLHVENDQVGEGAAHVDAGDDAVRMILKIRHLCAFHIHQGEAGAAPALHRSPSNALLSEAASPPIRACTRGPQAMTRHSTISSGRGPSGMPTSMASKWLRT